MKTYLQSHEAVQSMLADYDHYDQKSIVGEVSLREFLAGMLSYYPAWIKLLYRVRGGFVRLLGMKQDGLPGPYAIEPATVPFEVGSYAAFFKLAAAQEHDFWAAYADDRHLRAYVIVAVEPLANGRNRFHVGTVVKYHNWAGPVYFNVIRPFHHVVVKAMMKAGVRFHRSSEVIGHQV